MTRLNNKIEKKLRRDVTLSVNSPLGLALKYLATESAARAASNSQAILQRAIRPNVTTLPKILKNDKLIKWDGPLLLAASQILFEHQIAHLKKLRKHDKVQQLTQVFHTVNKLLIEDVLRVGPQAMYAILSALRTNDPSGLNIQTTYLQQRPEFTSDANNRIRSIANITGICMAYNFKPDGCDTANCPYHHHCIYHQTAQCQHPARRCSHNPTKWTSKKSNNNNSNNSYRRGRGRGRGRYNRYYQPPSWGYHPNSGYYPPPNYPPYPPNQGPPGYPGKDPLRNNSDHYFKKPGK